MNQVPSQCKNLEECVNILLRLFDKEPSLKGEYDIAAIKASRDKVVNPRFEIVFAGTYSAGKSMLINALLGKELLHSGTGHVTGRECYIEYANSSEEERVEFTFLNLEAIKEEVKERCQKLEIKPLNINREDSITKVLEECENRRKENANTEEADEAEGLQFLLQGFQSHRQYIHSSENKTYTMQDLQLDNPSC